MHNLLLMEIEVAGSEQLGFRFVETTTGGFDTVRRL